MSDFIFEKLQNQLSESLRESMITELQRELSSNAFNVNDNIYDTTKQISINSFDANKLDINTLLKYYTINQLLKESSKENVSNLYSNKYTETNNPDYKQNIEDKYYYRLNNGKLILDKKVSEILEDGSYVKYEVQSFSLYKIKTTYDIYDKIKSIHLIDPSGNVVTAKAQAAELLGMRKEYVKKFKYSGFSGNSNDIIAALLNSFMPPAETGLYMDKQYNIYNWSDYNKCFIRNERMKKLSPLLTDYEFKDSRTVIRKEYTGV